VPWIPTSHNGCEAAIADPSGNWKLVVNSREHAWMEAFATGFAMAATFRQPPDAQFAPGEFGSEAHTPCSGLPSTVGSDAIERNVADALRDLLDDGANEPADRLSRFTTAGGTPLDTLMLQVVDRELDTAAAPGVLDFRSAALGRGVPRADLDAILQLNGIATPSPAVPGPVPEPDPPSDLVCARKPWTPGC
jgi:hypothetical protein